MIALGIADCGGLALVDTSVDSRLGEEASGVVSEEVDGGSALAKLARLSPLALMLIVVPKCRKKHILLQSDSLCIYETRK